jgi:hypothetical protein
MDPDLEFSDSQRVPLPLPPGLTGAGGIPPPVNGDVDSEYAAAAAGGQPEGVIDAAAELKEVATEATARLGAQGDDTDEEVEVEYRPLHGKLIDHLCQTCSLLKLDRNPDIVSGSVVEAFQNLI